jgi:hypothetical protein
MEEAGEKLRPPIFPVKLADLLPVFRTRHFPVRKHGLLILSYTCMSQMTKRKFCFKRCRCVYSLLRGISFGLFTVEERKKSRWWTVQTRTEHIMFNNVHTSMFLVVKTVTCISNHCSTVLIQAYFKYVSCYFPPSDWPRCSFNTDSYLLLQSQRHYKYQIV